MKEIDFPIYLKVILVAILTAAILVILIFLRRTTVFAQTAISTEGEIINLAKGYSLNPIIKYKDQNGKEIIATCYKTEGDSDSPNYKPYKVGQKIHIYYNPKTPKIFLNIKQQFPC